MSQLLWISAASLAMNILSGSIHHVFSYHDSRLPKINSNNKMFNNNQRSYLLTTPDNSFYQCSFEKSDYLRIACYDMSVVLTV